MEKLKVTLCLLLVCFWMACSSSEPQSTEEASQNESAGLFSPLIQTNDNDPTTGNTTSSRRTSSSVSDADYHVNNGKIYKDGEEIRLIGINVNGFEENELLIHGLHTRDYKEMISQIKGLGFNAVRLPFCPAALKEQDISSSFATSGSSGAINSELVGKNSLEALDVIVEEFNSQEIFVLLVFVAGRYADLEFFMGIDLKNEPHEIFSSADTAHAVWGGGGANDWKRAAEEAAEAILDVNDNILIFVEGVGSHSGHSCTNTLYNHNWGGNLDGMKCDPLDIDPTKLVLSPHIYGPDVHVQPYFSDASYPSNLPTAWEDLFGYLSPDYALAIGEFGGMYDSTADIEWQDTFVDYMISQDLCSFFYWDWSPWSGDTGGILEGDWVSVDEDKFENLCRLMSYCDSSVVCE